MARAAEAGKRAFTVAGAYAVVAGTYIFVSSRFLGGEHLRPGLQAKWEIIKGLAFVLVTASLLFWAMRQQLRRVQRVEQRQLTTAAALMRAQQRASVALVAAVVAHEMKNVLMILEVSHQYVQHAASEQKAEIAQAMSNITEAVGRLTDLTAELLQRARPPEQRDEELFDLGDVVRRCARLAELFARERSCAIEVDAPAGLRLRGQSREVEQAVLNLIMNAIDAAGDRSGRVDIALERSGDRARLSVSDNGPGVPEELREHVFDAFFTTKGESGSGLGLAVVRDVVRRHGGDARSVPIATGARFEIELPLA